MKSILILDPLLASSGVSAVLYFSFACWETLIANCSCISIEGGSSEMIIRDSHIVRASCKAQTSLVYKSTFKTYRFQYYCNGLRRNEITLLFLISLIGVFLIVINSGDGMKLLSSIHSDIRIFPPKFSKLSVLLKTSPRLTFGVLLLWFWLISQMNSRKHQVH